MNNRSFRALLILLVLSCAQSAKSQTITGIVKAEQGGQPVVIDTVKGYVRLENR